MSTSKGHPVPPEDRTSLILFARVSGVRDSRRPEHTGAGEDESHAGGERGPVSEETGHESPQQGPEDRPESLDRVERSEGPRPSAFRCQAGHEGGARDVDHGPTRTDARMERDDEAQPRDVAESHDPEEEERAEQDGPPEASVQLHRPAPSRGDPTGDARVHRDRRNLTRDVDREDLRAPEPVHLRKENREEAVKCGEASEEEEYAEQVQSKRSRETVPGGIRLRSREMDDSHREVTSSLDPRMRIDQMDVLPVHTNRGLGCHEMNHDARGEREHRSDRE